MKKKILVSTLIIGAFIAGYSINNIAVSNTNPNYRVAIVDIQRVVANSNEIKNLKIEQEKQIQKMQSTINKAREEISKEQDPQKISALEEKYRNEINSQKLALDESYNKKLTAIDSKINYCGRKSTFYELQHRTSKKYSSFWRR